MSKSTYIEIENACDIINSWCNKVRVFDSNLPITTNTPSNGFLLLKEGGFDTKSFDSYNSNVKELSSYLVEFYSIVQSYLNNMNTSDNEVEHSIPNDIAKTVLTNRASSINVSNISKDVTSRSMRNMENEARTINKNKNINMSNLQFQSNNPKTNLVNIIKNVDDTKKELNTADSNARKIALGKVNNREFGVSNYDNSGYQRINSSGLRDMRGGRVEKYNYEDPKYTASRVELNKIKEGGLNKPSNVGGNYSRLSRASIKNINHNN